MEGLKKFVNSLEEMDRMFSPGQGRHPQGSQGSGGSFGGGGSVTAGSVRNGILNASLLSQGLVSQRIVNMEYYMTPPVKEFDNLHSEFRNSAVKKVPVVRIFGTTPAGQKMCANIHGVYPYISILDDDTIDGFEYRIAAALDNAINDSVHTNYGQKDGKFSKKGTTQHVFKVIRVVGKTFYGYRSSSEVFLRIFFYNPLILRKAVDLLQSASVLGRRFQPYEAHIPYTLQFMIDYCLYGMNYIHYSAVKFRRNSKDNASKCSEDIRSLSQGSDSSIVGYIDPEAIEESLLGPRQLNKSTLCELEIDVLASDIILETKVSEKAMSVNPGIDCIWKDEIERRRLQGVENCSQITIPESQERSQAPSMHSAEEKHMQTLCQKLESFFANNDESADEGSQKFPFSNNSYIEEAELIPSSQVLDHLSDESPPEDGSVSNNQLSQEEDEFINLLEKMAEEPERKNDNDTEENPFFENPDVDESPDANVNDEEDIWDDSLLDTSILDKILDAETTNEDSESNEKSSTDLTPTIFQCDGQGGDSDSNSESKSKIEKPKTKAPATTTTRLTRKMSEVTMKVKEAASSTKTVESHQQPTRRKSGRHSILHQSSPASSNRLSLTLRRKSRSQETIKSKSQDVRPGPASSKRKSLQRRSRSLSSDQREAKDSASQEKRKLQEGDSKKTKEKKTVTASRPVTRKSAAHEKPGSSKTSALNPKPTETSETKSGEVTNANNASVSNKIILNKEPILCLTKIDADPAMLTTANASKPTRARRKPRRFVEEEDTTPSSSQSQPMNADEPKSNQNEAQKDEMLKRNKTDGTSMEASRSKSGKLKGKKEEKILQSDKKEEVAVDEHVSGNSEEKTEEIKPKETKKKKRRKLQPAPASSDIEGQEEEKTSIVSEKGASDLSSTNGLEGPKKHDEKKVSRIRQLGIVKKKKKITEVKVVDSNSSEQSNGHVVENVNQLSQEDGTEKEQSKVEILPENTENKTEDVNSQSDKTAPQSETSSEAKPNEEENETQSNVEMQVDEDTKDNSEPPNLGIPTEPSKSEPLPKKKKKKKRLGLGMTKSIKSAVPSETSNSPIDQPKAVEDAVTLVPDVRDNNSEDFSNEEANVPQNNLEEESSNDKDNLVQEKQFSDIGITCAPDNTSAMSQTDLRPTTTDSAVSAKPIMKQTGSQLESLSTCSETQTDTKVMVTVETQTDAIQPLCLCQCTCVTKEKAEASVDNQDDLKPTMENKRVQVDNNNAEIRVRSARFTTPQNNKIRRTTPFKSPDKRKSFSESPSRRQMINATPIPYPSRYLSALGLKTPTSHHKYRPYNRSSPSTPSNSSTSQAVHNVTPPSREEYLINSIRAASMSPRKRTSYIKPRNLDIETNCEPVVANPVPQSPPPADNEIAPVNIEDEMHRAMESGESDDLSVNSIYEYEEPSPSPKVDSPLALPFYDPEESDEASPASLTSFQQKRILSKHRTKNRLEKRRVANLDANRYIPDVFEVEYEPLKQPASYKSTVKWLEAEKHRNYIAKRSPTKIPELNDESSDEECLPPPVKLFGGGNMSDDEDSDSDGSGHQSQSSGVIGNRNSIKPFTPPLINIFTPPNQGTVQDGNTSCNSGTPRSILRQGGSSRRSNARVSKRKIRWEDDESCKRIKTEEGSISVKTEIDDDSQSFLLNNGTLNRTADTSELDGPTFKNALGLENSMSNFQDVKALHQCQFLTTMCVEIHCASRNELLPDPSVDAITAIFVLISNDYPDNYRKAKEYLHVLILDDKADEKTTTMTESGLSQSTRSYSSEGNLIDAFIALVRLNDPDIFVGFEIEKSSFGYLIQRGLYFGKDLTQELSRVLPIKKEGEKENPFRVKDEWNGIIGGRIVLNLWRLLRHEIAVQSYTFENAAYHILLRRVCKFSQKTLNAYWSHRMHRHKVIQYYAIRVKGAMQIMEKLDLINRTSELARLFGIQFYEVLSRGSQFRVESMMLRATKPLDLIAPSPTVMQRAKMRAPEYLALILEPRSNYYTDPVAVLDFQSLYPSMMIAYNYDYASLLGRVEHFGQMENFPLGCLDHVVSPADLLRLKDHIHISPAGVAFVDKSIVKGVLPEMLEQILDTRQMVKRAMKKWKKEGASLQKVLDSRQLGLKLIANVTYGYTSANFSGRMPCVEVADSIVSKGRETLQRAIDYVKENQHRWGAEVVYGDTDSMFILFRGKTREEAFKSAYEIADEVTQANPKPVKLKFEKIYQPCILQSKKRYVGYAYETPEQVKPIYDAKGIETVRRDGCPAVRKILEKTLHVLFTYDKREKVESYVKSQFEKLFKGRVSMQDYIFAREFRGRPGYKPTACVPALEIAKRLTEVDPRAEPLVSERVPYVVIYGNPTLPLIKLVRTPTEYLKNPAMRLNAHYYIEKVIMPALNRCLKLAGMNVTKWYLQLPRKYLRNVLDQKPKGQGTLDDYVLHQNCLKCDGKAEQGLCNNCLENESQSVIYLQEVVRNGKSKLNSCIEICANCAGETDRCVSIDCPVLHKLTRYQRDQAYMKKVENELSKLEW